MLNLNTNEEITRQLVANIQNMYESTQEQQPSSMLGRSVDSAYDRESHKKQLEIQSLLTGYSIIEEITEPIYEPTEDTLHRTVLSELPPNNFENPKSQEGDEKEVPSDTSKGTLSDYEKGYRLGYQHGYEDSQVDQPEQEKIDVEYDEEVTEESLEAIVTPNIHKNIISLDVEEEEEMELPKKVNLEKEVVTESGIEEDSDLYEEVPYLQDDLQLIKRDEDKDEVYTYD